MSRHDDLSGRNVFLTGATGLIGGEMLRRLLRAGPSGPNRIFCLVRAAAPESAEDRLLRKLGLSAESAAYSSRVTAFVGDIRQPDLALSPDAASALRSQTDIVIHCAAETSFLRPRACEEVNVAGLRNVLEFAAGFARPIQFVYFGSAAACGDRRDACLQEEEYPRSGDDHFVRYTETKAIAESILRRQRLISSWLILRPSIVLPDTATEPSLVRGILWALVLMKDIRLLPIDGDARIDAVPLSYVGECAIRLIAKPDRRYDCYHISAGERRAATWDDILGMLRETFKTDVRSCGADVADLEKVGLSREERKLLRSISCYLPFINQNVIFSDRRLYQELDGATSSFRHYGTYVPQQLRRIRLDEALLGSQDP
jgi:thioester reductase-like protein